ncbi:hypothetical protein [Roseofilum casamattae]|uniref:Uncharacterized protein n=1 Tax=Roseofilum casamattae BLCC-M143 TaxID=3022442 RepID=A0ABT7C314_9CYAN|nr:hypothetical protein [Roseofilum casamattae]MDJ1185846.1 hypothetical protein [Roseofilum casamattae BLCC-M143]
MSFNYNTTSIVGNIVRKLSAKKSKYNSSQTQLPVHPIQQTFSQASPEVQQIVQRVLKAEKEKLHMSNPRYINEDILRIIKEEVKDSE